MKKIAVIIATAMALSSCEKVIELNLNNAEPKVIIEAALSNQAEPATVKISKTVNFYNNNNFEGVSGAKVSIKDAAGKETLLTETSVGIYQSQKYQAKEETTYTLNVEVEGKKYEAKSTMPKAVILNNIETSFSKAGPAGENFQITPIYTDPLEKGNAYRFIQYANNKPDPTYYVSNDYVRNGLVNIRPIFNPNYKLTEGDNYTLEMQCIDNSTYNYFYTLSQISGNGPGGGITPTNPPNNWNNGALGYFSAHTTQKISKVLKK
jgi:hypothetical protein